MNQVEADRIGNEMADDFEPIRDSILKFLDKHGTSVVNVEKYCSKETSDRLHKIGKDLDEAFRRVM